MRYGLILGLAGGGLRRRVLGLIVAVSLAAGFSASVAEAQQATAAQTVERLHTALIGIMRQAGALGFQGRYKTISPTVVASFNLGIMAKATVGRHWSRLDAQQQSRLVEAFTRMTLVLYAARFDDYAGERFETVGETQTARATLVRTRLVKANGDTIRLDYLLRQYDGQWRIIDVLTKGSYSELATRRSEYTSVLQREGFDSLIRKLDTKVREITRKEGLG